MVALIAIAVGAFPAVASAGPKGGPSGTMCSLNTQLRAENEVPPAAGAAFGHTQIKLRNDGTLEFETLIVNDGQTFVAGHVHGQASAGVNAGVVVPLFSGSTDAAKIRDSGAKAIDPGLAEAICGSPELYYVNYHSTQTPSGAVRGQLG